MSRDKTPPLNLQNLFSDHGVSYVPGRGYIGAGMGSLAGQSGLGRPSGLGDDASVMMISGLGQHMGDAGVPAPAPAVDANGNPVTAPAPPAGVSLSDALMQPITIGPVTLPLWAWLVIAAGGVGVAGYYLLYKK